MDQGTRWQQRFSSYKRALSCLDEAIVLRQARELSKLEQQGLLHCFEFTHELAWNCLKDFLNYQGEQNILGSRDATRKAFSIGLIEEGEVWMDMIRSRNLSSHTYNEEIALAVSESVATDYHRQFHLLVERLETIQREERD